MRNEGEAIPGDEARLLEIYKQVALSVDEIESPDAGTNEFDPRGDQGKLERPFLEIEPAPDNIQLDTVVWSARSGTPDSGSRIQWWMDEVFNETDYEYVVVERPAGPRVKYIDVRDEVAGETSEPEEEPPLEQRLEELINLYWESIGGETGGSFDIETALHRGSGQWLHALQLLRADQGLAAEQAELESEILQEIVALSNAQEGGVIVYLNSLPQLVFILQDRRELLRTIHLLMDAEIQRYREHTSNRAAYLRERVELSDRLTKVLEGDSGSVAIFPTAAADECYKPSDDDDDDGGIGALVTE